MSLNIKLLEAFNGDAILVSFDDNGKTRNILIDGGTGKTYSKQPKTLKSLLEQLKEKDENIDLLVITHIDDDHIGGIVRMFQKEKNNLDVIKKVWFNSGELISNFFDTRTDKKREYALGLTEGSFLSVRQGMTLEKKLKELDCWDRQVIFTGCPAFDFHGSRITILSPDKTGLKKLNDNWQTEKTKIGNLFLGAPSHDYDKPVSQLAEGPFAEDRSVPNQSSISFLFEYGGKKALFLGDAHPSVVAGSIKNLCSPPENKLEVDLVKVAHHSSRRNTSPELLELIKCKNYLISTDGTKHGLPDKEAMARIIALNKEKTGLLFNYDIAQKIFLPEDYREFNFDCKYLNNQPIDLS